MIAALERCTKPSALTVGRNVKFHSSPQKADLSTARNAGRNVGHQEDGSQISRMHENALLLSVSLPSAHADMGMISFKYIQLDEVCTERDSRMEREGRGIDLIDRRKCS